MVIMLGKRYLKKWEQKDKNDIADMNLYNLFKNPVANSIKKIVFNGFRTEGLVIEGTTIRETLDTLNKKENTKIKISKHTTSLSDKDSYNLQKAIRAARAMKAATPALT